mmetsp:Transcript_138425/g.359733  ORF Transcript_138425/g.359733 Transcript_138425/m.359733 type:complete len:615 (-) Transcript_138425:2286-4130(-)
MTAAAMDPMAAMLPPSKPPLAVAISEWWPSTVDGSGDSAACTATAEPPPAAPLPLMQVPPATEPSPVSAGGSAASLAATTDAAELSAPPPSRPPKSESTPAPLLMTLPVSGGAVEPIEPRASVPSPSLWALPATSPVAPLAAEAASLFAAFSPTWLSCMWSECISFGRSNAPRPLRHAKLHQREVPACFSVSPFRSPPPLRAEEPAEAGVALGLLLGPPPAQPGGALAMASTKRVPSVPAAEEPCRDTSGLLMASSRGPARRSPPSLAAPPGADAREYTVEAPLSGRCLSPLGSLPEPRKSLETDGEASKVLEADAAVAPLALLSPNKLSTASSKTFGRECGCPATASSEEPNWLKPGCDIFGAEAMASSPGPTPSSPIREEGMLRPVGSSLPRLEKTPLPCRLLVHGSAGFTTRSVTQRQVSSADMFTSLLTRALSVPSSMWTASAAMASKLRSGYASASISAALALVPVAGGPPRPLPPAVPMADEVASLNSLVPPSLSRSRSCCVCCGCCCCGASTETCDNAWVSVESGEAPGVLSLLLSFHAALALFGVPGGPSAPRVGLARLKSLGVPESRLDPPIPRTPVLPTAADRLRSSCKPSKKKAKSSWASCCS